jgi:hypothetical protein
MIDIREECIRNQEKAAAAAAAAAAAQAAQLQLKPNPITLLNNRLQVGGIHSLPIGTIPRAGALYESRSSISSPYGSGSSLNRTSSIRRASLRDREKVKKLNDNFLDVLQARDKIQEDIDENTTTMTITNGIHPIKLPNKDEHSSIGTTTSTDSTIRESATTPPVKKPIERESTKTPPIRKSTETPHVEIILPPLKVPPPLPPPPPPTQTTADTLSEVKRRREERRRNIGGPSTSTIPPPILPSIEMNNKTNTKMSNGNHLPIINDPMQNYSSEKYIQIHGHIQDDDREKRICCTIL